jgi:DNA-binding GntR family transcriptional regulator
LSKNLTQYAYETLREMILSWKLAPGSVLSEHQLADRLSISRTPIREAIHILEREGLARNAPGQSSTVAELSMREVIESYQMRIALESYAARLAAGNSRSRELLMAIHEEMKHSRRMLNRGELEAYHQLSERADGLIAAAAENRYLSQALQSTWGNVRRIRHVADVTIARLHDSVDEHLAVLEAVIAGDEDRAEQASRAHLTHSLNHVLRSLARLPDGDLVAAAQQGRGAAARTRGGSATSTTARKRPANRRRNLA